MRWTWASEWLAGEPHYLLGVGDVAGIGQDKGAELVKILHGPAPLVTGRVFLPREKREGEKKKRPRVG